MPNQQAFQLNGVTIANAQTGNGATTDVADRRFFDSQAYLVNPVVQITTTIGATPTCTYAVEGSLDGSNWYAMSYADSATPTTYAVATFAITTATTKRVIVQANQTPARYLRVTFSANTNVTNTVTVFAA